MFQSFEVNARPEQGPPRLAQLRARMQAEGLDGFLVPRADAHQGEYVAPRDDRLAWLTGFTGSAGFCAALMEAAGVFVDGRYRTQVKSQVDLAHFTPEDSLNTELGVWLTEHLVQGGKVGFDPWLYTRGQIETLMAELDGSAVELEPCANLIDQIWQDQPEAPDSPVCAHPIEFSGESHSSKRARLGKELQDAGRSAAILTLPDSICWLLNIRGADIPCNPVCHAFAILHASGAVDLFIEPSKLERLGDHLGPDIAIRPQSEFIDAVGALEGDVLVDKQSIPVLITGVLGKRAVFGKDPCALPKACKNEAEIEGAVQAHLRDGAAIVELLSWLDGQRPGSITEIDVVRQLESFRRQDDKLRNISFETICGTGPNGAIMHYRVSEESNATLEEGHLLVLDSGGQYLDGTTDITRTIAIGTPREEERACFTRVLQGMIAMSGLRWPRGLGGAHIEMLGRLPLWMAGQDFDHGLGHGVGAYLSVHEGPQRLSRASTEPLRPGMILSNEPGYYREGAFGIRIENLVVVQEAEALQGGDEHRKMLNWQTLTLAPIDRRLIVTDMLSQKERHWLNAYHADVQARISKLVSKDAAGWLAKACAAL
jgi:Xaa-Pro aminopeptidase